MYLESNELPAVIGRQDAECPFDSARRLVDSFLTGRTSQTLRTYQQSLEEFAAFVEATSLPAAVHLLLTSTAGKANALVLEYRNRLVEQGRAARFSFPVHPHMLRHATGFHLANEGQDTRAIQLYLGHKNIQHTVRYTELSQQRFKDFWQD